MSTLAHESVITHEPGLHRAPASPVRSVLRSGGVLLAALGLTVVVLVALASVVDTWV